MSPRRPSSPAPAAHETLTERAYRQLEEQIVTLQLLPGEFVFEHALAASLAIGRTPIREALQRLAREGLVDIRPRRGVKVCDVDPSRQLLVLEVRRELERLLSRLAAERATEAQRLRFAEIAGAMDAAATTDDGIAFMRLDRALNDLVTAAAHNDYAARAMRLIQGHSRRFWYVHHRATGDLARCARLHAVQARAIADRGPAAAARAADDLLDYTVSFTRAANAARSVARTGDPVS